MSGASTQASATISVNGHAHYYDQDSAEDEKRAEENECGTAGCIAGFVFAHARHVQKKRTLRGARAARDYIRHAACIIPPGYDQNGVRVTEGCDDEVPEGAVPILYHLYREGGDTKLAEARKVVERMLRTGKVVWLTK